MEAAGDLDARCTSTSETVCWIHPDFGGCHVTVASYQKLLFQQGA